LRVLISRGAESYSQRSVDVDNRALACRAGAISLLAIVVVLGGAWYYFTIGVKPRDGRATEDDVRFVLNWPGLGDQRIEAIVQSHESIAHPTGDHFTAYAIRVTTLAESELVSNPRWVRGDRADTLMKEAIRFVTDARNDAQWLPTAEELLTDKYYVWRWRVEVTEGVSAASLIFARPSDRMIFYISLQV
jgi:hypothetical protein